MDFSVSTKRTLSTFNVEKPKIATLENVSEIVKRHDLIKRVFVDDGRGANQILE